MHYEWVCDGVMLRLWWAGWQEDRGCGEPRDDISAGLSTGGKNKWVLGWQRARRSSDFAEERTLAVCIQCGPEDLCAPTHDITAVEHSRIAPNGHVCLSARVRVRQTVTWPNSQTAILNTHHRTRTHNIALWSKKEVMLREVMFAFNIHKQKTMKRLFNRFHL